MLKKNQLSFKVGQSAEARSFQCRYRGAWFRCKIKKISGKNALVEFFDYPDEKLTWTRLYQLPPYHIGTSKEKRQLMLRPQYPQVMLKNEGLDVNSISDAVVVVDGNWQAGDLVDWWANGCYWSGHLTRLLGKDKAEIALTPPPMGEGAIYEVFFKDLRSSLIWSPSFGWILPTSQNLEIHSMSEGRKDNQATAGLSSDASFSPHLSETSQAASDEKRDFKTIELVEQAHPKEDANTSKKVRWSDFSSGSHMGDDSTKETSCRKNRWAN